jgi:hypothetical protein
MDIGEPIEEGEAPAPLDVPLETPEEVPAQEETEEVEVPA